MNISSKISDFGRLVYSNYGLYACKIWHGYRTNSYKCDKHILDAFIRKWPKKLNIYSETMFPSHTLQCSLPANIRSANHITVALWLTTGAPPVALDPCLIYDTDRYGWIWWSTLRMRARQAPLPPTTADCHLDYFPVCMPPRPTDGIVGQKCGLASARWLPASRRYRLNFDPLYHFSSEIPSFLVIYKLHLTPFNNCLQSV